MKNTIKLLYGISIPTVVSKSLAHKYNNDFLKIISDRCGEGVIINQFQYNENFDIIGFSYVPTDMGVNDDIIKINDDKIREWQEGDIIKNQVGVLLEEILITWRDYEISHSDINKEILLPEFLEFDWYIIGY